MVVGLASRFPTTDRCEQRVSARRMRLTHGDDGIQIVRVSEKSDCKMDGIANCAKFDGS